MQFRSHYMVTRGAISSSGLSHPRVHQVSVIFFYNSFILTINPQVEREVGSEATYLLHIYVSTSGTETHVGGPQSTIIARRGKIICSIVLRRMFPLISAVARLHIFSGSIGRPCTRLVCPSFAGNCQVLSQTFRRRFCTFQYF